MPTPTLPAADRARILRATETLARLISASSQVSREHLIGLCDELFLALGEPPRASDELRQRVLSNYGPAL